MSKIRINPDGTQTVLEEKASSSTVAPPASTKTMTPARARLLRLAGKDEAETRIETVKIEGDENPYFILRVNFAELTRLGLLTPRDENGTLDMLQPDSLTALTAAMLFCCVVRSETEAAPLFVDLFEAYEWAQSTAPAIKQIVGGLFFEIDRINPDIINSGASESTDASAEKKTRVKKRAKSSTRRAKTVEKASTPPPNDSLHNGSTNGATSAAPAISQSDSEYSANTLAVTSP